MVGYSLVPKSSLNKGVLGEGQAGEAFFPIGELNLFLFRSVMMSLFEVKTDLL